MDLTTAAVARRDREAARDRPEETLSLGEAWRLGFGALGAAALAELLVLRLGSRTVIHIPGLDSLAGPLTAVSTIGRYLYYVAAVLLVISLAIGVRALAAAPSRAVRLAAAGVVTFGAGAVAGLFGWSLLSAVLTLAGVMLCLPAAAHRSARDRVVLGAFTIAFVAFGLHTLVQLAAQAGYGSLQVTWLLGIGEISALVFALGSPWLTKPARGRLDRVALGTGVIVAALVGAMGLSGSSTGQILALWNFGLGGYLPLVAYGAGAGAIAYTGVAMMRAGRRAEAVALLLLVCGGAGLHSTYQTGLVVAGLALFSLAPAEQALPAPLCAPAGAQDSDRS